MAPFIPIDDGVRVHVVIAAAGGTVVVLLEAESYAQGIGSCMESAHQTPLMNWSLREGQTAKATAGNGRARSGN